MNPGEIHQDIDFGDKTRSAMEPGLESRENDASTLTFQIYIPPDATQQFHLLALPPDNNI